MYLELIDILEHSCGRLRHGYSETIDTVEHTYIRPEPRIVVELSSSVLRKHTQRRDVDILLRTKKQAVSYTHLTLPTTPYV